MTTLENLIKLLSRLPGVGSKSAARIAYSLIKSSDDYNSLLSESIATVKSKVKPCSICGAYTETDVCPMCTDSTRDKTILCVVEQPQDVVSIQSAGIFQGLYHVLGGAINPLNGVGPEDLSFNSLIKRVKEGSFKEIIIATNPTEEGNLTASYIQHLFKEVENIKLTRLASGLPIGGDLEYADANTLKKSLMWRVEL